MQIKDPTSPLMGQEVIAKGPAVRYGEPPIDGGTGYALTHNVEEDFWNQWHKENKAIPFVKMGMIFAAPKSLDARAMSKERKGLKTGIEPLDPEKPGTGIEPVSGAGGPMPTTGV